MTKREQIIQYLETELKKIKKANGFNTDAGNYVFAWRDNPLQKTELPGLIYRDALVSKEAGTIGRFRWMLRVEIACFGRTAAEIRQMVADVIKVIGNCEQAHFGGLVTFADLVSGDMAIERHEIELGASIVTMDITYECNAWEA